MATDLLPAVPDAPGEAIQALKHLTPAELQEAQQVARALDVRDSVAVSAYGVKAQNDLRSLSDPILQTAAGKDAGLAGDILIDMLAQVQTLDAGSPGALAENAAARLPLVGHWFSKARQLLARYQKISVKIERIRAALDTARNGLSRDIAVLDQLYGRNMATLRALLMYVAAGELKLDELRAMHAQAAAAAAPDPVLSQQVTDLSNVIARLERKVFDLRLAAMVAIQTAPQIRLIQNGNQALVDKIQTSIMLTIPLWQNQLSMAITLLSQQRSMKAQRIVTDATGALIRANADRVREGSMGAQREAERGIVELESLQHANDQLIATIEDSLKIQAEGRQRRTEAASALEQMQQDLQRTLVEGPRASG